jgi:transposase
LSSENEIKDKVIAYVVFEASKLNDDLKDYKEYYRTHSAPVVPSGATTKEIKEIEAKINKFHETKNFKFLNCGIFIFISTIDVPVSSILPLYYTRQEVEQLIDKFKNNCNSIPLKVHSDSAIRGHLFLSFLTLIACCEITNKLKNLNYGINFIMKTLRGLKCTVKNDWVETTDHTKLHKQIADTLGVVIPDRFKITWG